MRLPLAIMVSVSLCTPAFSAENRHAAFGKKIFEAPSGETSLSEPRLPKPPMSEQTMASYGCFFTGTAGTAGAVTFGAENLANLIAGGIVAPTNVAVLTIGVLGVVFASFCTVGQALTPMAVDLSERLEEPTSRTLSMASEYIQKFRDTLSPFGEAASQRVIEPAGDMVRHGIAMAARSCVASETCSSWLNGWASGAADLDKPQ